MKKVKKKLIYNVSSATDAGALKHVNEDRLFYKTSDEGAFCAGVFAVADGVGGLEQGALASSIAISEINTWWDREFKKHSHEQVYLGKTLIESVQNANDILIAMAEAQHVKMATTLSVLFLYNDHAMIIHIGDSRIYCFHGLTFSKTNQMTKDHTCFIHKNIEGRAVKQSVLTDCLGYEKELRYDCSGFQINKNDLLMLCSDGIYKTISQHRLLKQIKKNHHCMNSLCQSLIQTAKKNGEKDNISIITIQITD